jgi:hypothetical protein
MAAASVGSRKTGSQLAAADPAACRPLPLTHILLFHDETYQVAQTPPQLSQSLFLGLMLPKVAIQLCQAAGSAQLRPSSQLRSKSGSGMHCTLIKPHCAKYVFYSRCLLFLCQYPLSC